MELEIKNLSFKYDKDEILKNINVKLKPGVYGLLGPNGAGKSTLINLITDNIKRKQGEILLDGVDILKLGKNYMKKIGYMPQEQGYYEDFTAYAFLKYMASLKGVNKSQIKEQVERVLNLVNLSDSAKMLVGSYSGGMRQRLLLAQTLLNDPDILILDEPTAGVDPQERINIRNIIREIATEKIIIIATHIVSDIESISDEIILLKKGEIIKKTEPFKLIDDVSKRIIEVEVDKVQLQKLQDVNSYHISNIGHDVNGFIVKIICKDESVMKSLHEEYKIRDKVSITNLEDVYLYYFKVIEDES